MANLTTYLENKLLDAALRNVAYTSTSTYVALLTTLPTMPAGSGYVEATGTPYVRLRLDTQLAAAASGQSVTTGSLSWPQATNSWGTVLGVGVFDASVAGNLLLAGPLSGSQTISSGDTFSISTGNFLATLS